MVHIRPTKFLLCLLSGNIVRKGRYVPQSPEAASILQGEKRTTFNFPVDEMKMILLIRG